MNGSYAELPRFSGPSRENWYSILILTSIQTSPSSSLFFPLQYPSLEVTSAIASRIAVLRQRQKAVEAKLADTKGFIGDHRAEINDLELIHASLGDDIVDAQLLAGPWYPSRIPAEILCEIFHCYILFFQHSAWTTSQVCRAWRRIALGCSSLWNKLYVTTRIPRLSNGYRCPDSFVQGYMTTELQAQRAIRRARQGPLHVVLRLTEGTRDPNVTLRLLKIVGGQNLSRWRSLDWYDPMLGNHWTPGLQQALLPTCEMTSLERLSFRDNVCHLLVPALAAGVPSLSSLEMTLTHGDHPTMLMTQPWLKRLRKLTLLHRCQPSTLWPFIAECKALEELRLGGNVYSSSESFKSPGGHPLPHGLRKVRLETHVKSWSCVSGLNITSLTLQAGHNPLKRVHAAPGSVTLPSLIELICSSYGTAFAAGRLLYAPKTQLLRIWSKASGKNAVRDIFWDTPWGIHPVHVSIMTFEQNPATLRDLFRRLSKVTTLSWRFSFRFVDELLALIPDPEKGDDIELCPNLTQVGCQFIDPIPSSEASLVDSLILTTQDRRENMGLSRPRIDIDAKKGAVSG